MDSGVLLGVGSAGPDGRSLEHLRADGRWVDRVAVRMQVFHGRIAAAEMDDALAALNGSGKAEEREVPTDGRNRHEYRAAQ